MILNIANKRSISKEACKISRTKPLLEYVGRNRKSYIKAESAQMRKSYSWLQPETYKMY